MSGGIFRRPLTKTQIEALFALERGETEDIAVATHFSLVTRGLISPLFPYRLTPKGLEVLDSLRKA